jgi:hypothetical protein
MNKRDIPIHTYTYTYAKVSQYRLLAFWSYKQFATKCHILNTVPKGYSKPNKHNGFVDKETGSW